MTAVDRRSAAWVDRGDKRDRQRRAAAKAKNTRRVAKLAASRAARSDPSISLPSAARRMEIEFRATGRSRASLRGEGEKSVDFCAGLTGLSAVPSRYRERGSTGKSNGFAGREKGGESAGRQVAGRRTPSDATSFRPIVRPRWAAKFAAFPRRRGRLKRSRAT